MDESTKLSFESMGLKGSVQNPPRTAEEWAEQAGPNGKSLIATGISNVKAHSIMGDFRSDVMDLVYEQTKVEPKTKDKLDDKGEKVKDSAGNTVQVWNEQPEAYVSRVAASLGKSVTDAFQSIADDWSGQHSFMDWLVPGTARVGGAGVKDREEASKILTDPSRLARVRSALSQNGINIPEVVDAAQLALAIRDLRNKLAQAAIS